MNLKNKLLLLVFVLLASCSSENLPIENIPGDPVADNNDPEEDPVQTESFTIALIVDGDYFEPSFEGWMVVGDAQGSVLAQKALLNNTENRIDLEIAADSQVVFSYVTRDDRGFAKNFEIHTFTDIESGEYVLNADSSNGNGDTFTLAFNNTGTDFESISVSSANASYSTANGGTYNKEFQLNNYPGTFYGVYKSSNDTQPRYYFDPSVERNSMLEFDFASLPFVQNTIDIELPMINIKSASLYGFMTNEGKRVMHLLDSSDNKTTDSLYFEGSLFDNYEINAWMQCCNDIPVSYQLRYFGLPEDRVIELPNYEATLINSAVGDFSLASTTAHDYNTVYFSNGIASIYDDIYSFYIHGKGGSSLSFSMEKLLDTLLQDEGITSSYLDFRSVKLLRNTALPNYGNYIQSILAEPLEYPSGTYIESGTFFNSSF